MRSKGAGLCFHTNNILPWPSSGRHQQTESQRGCCLCMNTALVLGWGGQSWFLPGLQFAPEDGTSGVLEEDPQTPWGTETRSAWTML